jgi:signal transduction histidine kinase
MVLSGRRPEAKIRLKPDCSLADRRSVEGAPQFGALAETAAGLTQQMQAHLAWMARTLADRWVALDRKFRKRLKELGYSAAQAASLVEITPGAAGQMLAAGRSLSDFLEQVQYRGRRLAKLDLAPAQVVAALREFDLLLDKEGASRFGSRDADLRWARNQLHFLVVLTLNDAYYVVREAESQTFYGLFRAQTESRSLDALWERSLHILTAFSGAAEAGIFVCQPDGTWVAAAGLPDWKGEAAEVTRTALRRLARPCLLEAGGRGQDCILGPGWRETYVSVWSVPMLEEGQLRGVLQFAFPRRYEWLPRELALLEDAAARCWEAAEKARLLEELAERERQIRRLAEHMVEIEEAERRRISRELHDEAGQSLLYTRLQLEMLEQQAAVGDPALRAKLRELRETVEHSILEIRRLIGALSPAVLEQMGLAAALRQLAARFRQVHPAEVRVQIPRKLELPRRMEIIIYRLVQEALNNAAKYSRASHVNLSVETADGVLRLSIEDDGVGFDVKEALSRQECYGLSGLSERVALLGGVLEVESVRKSGESQEAEPAGRDAGGKRHGTRIRVMLPLPASGHGPEEPDRGADGRSPGGSAGKRQARK